MTTARTKTIHERWLRELTCIPTAAGHEDRVEAWVERWVAARSNLRLRRDAVGNLIITRRPARRGRPIFITAHLDHPAFIVRRLIGSREVELEFRGGVQDAYFQDARIEIFGSDDQVHRGRITQLQAQAKPFKRVLVRLSRATDALAAGDIGRWVFGGTVPRVSKGVLYTHACDDLAAVAAALATLDVLRKRKAGPNVGVLLTRAEEIGFIGAIGAAKRRSVPRTSRLLCLENSRSFPESPIGGGAILRVGDRVSVFSPELTTRLGRLLTAHAAKDKSFVWQRKLMAGGMCESTAFAALGYESTCLCLPLGNYHNMTQIDEVRDGLRPARVGPEHIALSDYHGLIQMLVICTTGLDSAKMPSVQKWLHDLYERHKSVVE